MINEYKEVAERLADNVESVVRYLFPNGKNFGNSWATGDVKDTPSSKGSGSFRVVLKGANRGLCKDFNGADESSFDLLDAWLKRFDLPNKQEALKQAKAFLNLPHYNFDDQNTRKKKVAVSKKTDQPDALNLSMDWVNKLKSRLNSNPKAKKYLYDRSLTDETIDYFGLGLSFYYKERDSENALVFPILTEEGKFKKPFGYYNIPDVTKNPTDKNGWMSGSPQVYYTHSYTKQKTIFVCEGIKDSWVLYQNLKENNLLDQILICSSTHGSGIPTEFKSDVFWQKFEKIYLGHDHDSAGDKMAEIISQFALKDCYRVKCPVEYANPKYDANGIEKDSSEWGADWTDFFKKDGCIELFTSLLDEAEICSTKITESFEDDLLKEGTFDYKPIDINNAYINGFMYYPVETFERKIRVDEYGNKHPLELRKTVIVRSDAVTLSAIKMQAPEGTPDSKRIVRLSDGTLIRSEPSVNEYATWEWASISAYINGKARIRDTKDIYTDIHSILQKTIWLPVKEDYVILALSVLTTYVQNIFDSVPILFLNGAAGTGKSQTGVAMANICCNGSVIGQVSAASAARHIDAARGFVVFDDLEGIASKGGKDGQFNELVQALKVSYNKHTAEKIWTDVKTMKTQRLNFYGVKLISNTAGVDDILSTRMLRIQTRHIPDSEKGLIKTLVAEDYRKIHNLRQELHAWAFKNCREIERIKKDRDINKTGRFDEIALPLRTIASMVSKTCSDALEKALQLQKTVSLSVDNIDQAIVEASKNLIKDGFFEFTTTHLIMELRLLLDDNYGKSMTNEIADWERPEWIGRKLRTLGMLDNSNLGRKELMGKNLKVMKFDQYLIDEAIGDLEEFIGQKPFNGFCLGCSSCPYAKLNCEFREVRMQKERQGKIKATQQSIH